MPPELLRTFGFVLAVIVSAPISLACLRAASFFGAFKHTVEQMTKSVEALSVTVADHSSRIPVLETEVRNLKGEPLRPGRTQNYDRREA
jgi:hypothetical protein